MYIDYEQSQTLNNDVGLHSLRVKKSKWSFNFKVVKFFSNITSRIFLWYLLFHYLTNTMTVIYMNFAIINTLEM